MFTKLPRNGYVAIYTVLSCFHFIKNKIFCKAHRKYRNAITNYPLCRRELCIYMEGVIEPACYAGELDILGLKKKKQHHVMLIYL
jgi:hypothetical protein